jgi:hypothetical protein
MMCLRAAVPAATCSKPTKTRELSNAWQKILTESLWAGFPLGQSGNTLSRESSEKTDGAEQTYLLVIKMSSMLTVRELLPSWSHADVG